jgi:hypothetical protein
MIKLNKKRHLVGYSLSKTAPERHRVLSKIIKKRKPLIVFHELNAKAILTKNTQPQNSKKYRSDANFIRKML